MQDRSDDSRRRVTAGVQILSFLILTTIPGFLAATVDVPVFNLASIMVGLIILYSSIHLAQIAASPRQQVIRTTFWLFVYVFFGVTPFVQIMVNFFPWGGTYEIAVLVKTAVIVLVGLIAFDAGHYVLPAVRGVGTPKALQKSISKFGVALVGIGGLVSAPYLIQQVGGLYVFFLPRALKYQAVTAEIESSAKMLLLTRLLSTPMFVSLIAALAIWVALRQQKRAVGFKWKCLALVLFIATMVLNNPISTPRFQIGTILLSLFFVLPWRRWSNLMAVGGLIVGLTVIFPFTDLFRSSLDASLTQRIAETDPTAELIQGDFDAFQVVANTTSVIAYHDHQLGRQITGALLFWVPRTLWPTKPISTGQWVAERKGYHFTNLSAPLWTELYVDGGWILLVVGFLGYGAFVRTLDGWYVASLRDGRVQIISALAPIFAGYQFFLLRGSLMPAAAYLAPMVLFLLLCSLRVPANLFKRHRLSSNG